MMQVAVWEVSVRSKTRETASQGPWLQYTLAAVGWENT